MIVLRPWIAVSALAAAVALAGCSAPPARPAAGAAPGVSKPATSDDRIAAAVRQKFAASPALKNETITVKVRDGRVSLSGTVTDGMARIEAENVARSVGDVFGVDAENLLTK